MPCHISFRDVSFSGELAGVTAVLTTDVECHCFIRYSSQLPRIHKKPSYRRGVWLNDDVRFCFTVFQDLEQAEPWDTKTHTFFIPGWLYCMTWYVYFWGKVAGVECVSTSPLFHYHNDYVEPPHVYIEAGHPAQNYSSYMGRNSCMVCVARPATGTGTMNIFKCYHTASSNIATYIGFFYPLGGGLWKCRVATVFSIPRGTGYYERAISLPCQHNDLLGIYTNVMSIKADSGEPIRPLWPGAGINGCVTGWSGVLNPYPGDFRAAYRTEGLT